MTPDAGEAAAILTSLPEGLVLGELLNSPEVAVVAADADGVVETLRRLGAEVAKKDSALGLAGRATVGTPRCERLEITLTPARGAEGWEEPLPLGLALVVWAETDRHVVGYLPALKLAVAGRSLDAVRERAAAAAKRVAVRSGATRDLRWWAARHRLSEVALGGVALEAPRRSALALAKAAAEASEAEDRDEPVMGQVTTDLTSGPGSEGEPAYEVDATLRALADLLRERPSQQARPSQKSRSVLLVGPSGVGKTAAVRSWPGGAAASAWAARRSGPRTGRGWWRA